MSESIYNQYYLKQVGSGISVYSGNRYQKGSGSFFGKIIKYLKPALKYISRTGLTAASEMTKNLASGQSFKNAAKSQLISTGENMLKDSMEKMGEIKAKQKGRGYKRKRKTSVKRKAKKLKKTKPRKKLYKRRRTRKRKTKKIVSIF